jgi:hypothetical protein
MFEQEFLMDVENEPIIMNHHDQELLMEFLLLVFLLNDRLSKEKNLSKIFIQFYFSY